MQSLYLATTFAAAIACLLTSLLLFARRKNGERSRLILACIVLFSVVNYILRFSALCHGEKPQLVISVPMLILALFMVISYIMYPIEVISPGYLNVRRILKLYSPCILLGGIYALSLQLGVSYPPFYSLLDILPQIREFHAWFRLLLAIFIFAPVLFIYITPYTRRYNNTDRTWIMKYTLCFTVNTIAYMIILISDLVLVKTLYYYISAGCSIYIAYLELFERLINQCSTTANEAAGTDQFFVTSDSASRNEWSVANELITENKSKTEQDLLTKQESLIEPELLTENESFTKEGSVTEQESASTKLGEATQPEHSDVDHNPLCKRILLHMNRTYNYRNSDLSLNMLASSLFTNRTTLSNALHELGYSSFNNYINTLRIEEFIQRVQNSATSNYQDVFYDVGFRSRATALRNFKQYTGKTPSEFFSERSE